MKYHFDEERTQQGLKATDLHRISVGCLQPCANSDWCSSSAGSPCSACGVHHTAIAHHIYGLPIDDTSSDTFRNAGTWVGVIFGYNGVSAICSLFSCPGHRQELGEN